MTKAVSLDKRISAFFLFLLLIFSAPYTLRPLWTEIKMSYDWKGVFADYQNIGANCKVTMQPKTDLSDTERLELGRSKAVSFRIPFRAEPTYVTLPENNWTYVGCEFDPQNIENFTSPLMFFGPIWGQSVVYLNDQEVRRLADHTYLTLPLSQGEWSKHYRVEIVSVYRGRGAGPMSLIPWVLLPSESDLRAVQRVLNYSTTEKTLVPLGISGTLFILFLCCWIFGVRYRDVYWMIVACAAATVSSALSHQPTDEPPAWYFRYRLFFDMVCWASIWVAIFTFLRKQARQLSLILFVLGVAGVYQLQWLIPQPLRAEWIGSPERYDGVWIGPILLILGLMAYRVDGSIPTRRSLQRRILGVILILFSIWVFWGGLYGFRLGFSFQNLTRTTLLALFGAFMIIDLVIFQRAYFEEKSLKEEEERRRSALEDRMELGFSIQRLLMPNATSKRYGPFSVSVFYECADMMAGDWFYWSECSNELRVLLGDVVGKGPQAAIAATSILTMCHNFSNSENSLEGFLDRLNRTVVELFQSKPISTIGAAGLSADGEIRVINHGFSGWLHVKPERVDIIGQRGPALGTWSEMNWDVASVRLAPGEKLVIFSDGVAEGPRAIKRLCDGLAANAHRPPEDLIKLIIDIGKSSVVEDDRTVIVIERS